MNTDTQDEEQAGIRATARICGSRYRAAIAAATLDERREFWRLCERLDRAQACLGSDGDDQLELARAHAHDLANFLQRLVCRREMAALGCVASFPQILEKTGTC
jgi:hypothetical protein